MLSRGKRAVSELVKLKELEESMDQKLEDLGLLEQGMTFNDKAELLKVVQMSENTAQAEEDQRKTTKATSMSPPAGPRSQKEEIVKEEDEEDPDIEITQVFFPSDVVMKLAHNLDEEKESVPSPVAAEPKTSVMEEQQPLEPDSVENDVAETSVKNQFQKERSYSPGDKAHAGQNSIDESSLQSSASEHKEPMSPAEKQDGKKSLDVFSYNQEPYLRTFCRSKVWRTQEKIPFYVLQRGMDLHMYTTYFKCYFSEYFKRLQCNQRRHLEHLEWGPPIAMVDPSISDFRRKKFGEGSDSSRRYNFRNRLEKPKVIDFASDNSEVEEESNDEDIFTPRSKKLPGLKLTSKRKISSSNDVVSPKKDKKESVFESKTSNAESSQVVTSDVPNNGVFTKKPPRSRLVLTNRKRNRRQGQVKADTDLIENSDITSTSELVTAPPNDGENLESGKQNEETVLKPATLSIKHKKVLISYEKGSKPARRRTEVENADVEFTKIDGEDSSQDLEHRIPCPICRSMFPAKNIEEHASDCNQYHPDTSTMSTEEEK